MAGGGDIFPRHPTEWGVWARSELPFTNGNIIDWAISNSLPPLNPTCHGRGNWGIAGAAYRRHSSPSDREIMCLGAISTIILTVGTGLPEECEPTD